MLFGSAAGAIAIHLAFLACGTPPQLRDAGRDTGIADAMGDNGIADAMGDIASRETGTADAQGMPCNCLPDLPPASFHFVPPAGITVRPDYSRAFVNASTTLVSGAPGLSVSVLASFFTESANAQAGQFVCTLGVVLGTVRSASCSFSTGDGSLYQATAVPGAVVTVTDSTIAVDIPSLTLTRQGAPTGDAGAPSVTLNNVQLRGFGRNLLAVPSQFRRQ